MATQASSYKPSPLGYGSPRSSPFRRPESPVSPSLHQTTPSTSPFKNSNAGTSTANAMPPARFGGGSSTPAASSSSWTPRTQLQAPAEITGLRGPRPSPSTSSRSPVMPSTASGMGMVQGSALTQLQPAQVQTLREGFQILDRDSDGTVDREDVADMLNQLGLPSSPADVSQFFPPSAPQTINMGTFLNSLANALAAMSPSSELLSALSAFDEDDSGQVDLAELRDALLHTAPELGERALTETEINRVMQGFTGRRAFTSKSKPGSSGFGNKRGEVFKYQDFVQSIAGSSQASAAEGEAATDV